MMQVAPTSLGGQLVLVPALQVIGSSRGANPGTSRTSSVPFSAAAVLSVLGATVATTGLTVSRGRARKVAAVVRHVTKAPVVIDGVRSDTIASRGEKELDRYRIVFSADDGSDWIKGNVTAIQGGSSGALLTVEVEASREYVALRRSYRSPGQKMKVKIGRVEEALTVASPPLSLSAQAGQLWRLKGDIYAGQTKKEAEKGSVRISIEVYRPSTEGVAVGEEVEVGPFTDEAIDLRPVLGRFQVPALAFLCDGSPEAVCTLRALMEAENCSVELSVRERTSLLFCARPSQLPGSLGAWLEQAEAKFKLAVVNFQADVADAWDKDGRPAVAELETMQMRLGAVVLGQPAFVEAMTKKLSSEGVTFIASSARVQTLARVLDPEQI